VSEDRPRNHTLLKQGDNKMSSKVAIINVNLEYEFSKDTTEEEIKTFLHNVELPKEYVEDSFEFVKILES